MTVPPGLRPPPYDQRGNFETIEVTPPVGAPVETVETGEDRHDIAVIGPIAALVLALTISTLVLDHPAARAVAAGLATLGLVVAVVLMVLGKKPKPGRHLARHAVDPEATERIPSGWSGTDRR
ncbi:hypothetical protein SAMN05216188_105115 [Lentzea xinjiangensis]|uniref:Uncharacterized protein n=1 Tax=Lentzea xinjiangensis TaxID=402600 RepID=A0A1H9IWH5_9PSEU|nr:hypothetical protein [Lentzea xinjiangensis]SEQ79151.1 hypothetical protein SAMN05216188_105115 [Lentzea xinjiangensis]